MKTAKKLLATLLAVSAIMSTMIVSASATEDASANVEPTAPREVVVTYEPLVPTPRDGYVWSYSADIEYDVQGTEVERVYGWSTCKTQAGTNVNHYSVAYYQHMLTGSVRDRVYKEGYGKVYAYTNWIDSTELLLHTGKFNYGEV